MRFQWRFFNIYGNGQSPRICWGNHQICLQGWTTVSRPVINGDGLQVRDFISVQDVGESNSPRCSGYPSVHENNNNGKIVWNGKFNIGTGVPTRIIDLAN